MRYLESSSRSVSYFNINILQTINKATVTQLSSPPSGHKVTLAVIYHSWVLFSILFQISTLKTSKPCQTKLSTQNFRLGKADLQCPGHKAFLNLLWRITIRSFIVYVLANIKGVVLIRQVVVFVVSSLLPVSHHVPPRKRSKNTLLLFSTVFSDNWRQFANFPQ